MVIINIYAVININCFAIVNNTIFFIKNVNYFFINAVFQVKIETSIYVQSMDMRERNLDKPVMKQMTHGLQGHIAM